MAMIREEPKCRSLKNVIWLGNRSSKSQSLAIFHRTLRSQCGIALVYQILSPKSLAISGIRDGNDNRRNRMISVHQAPVALTTHWAAPDCILGRQKKSRFSKNSSGLPPPSYYRTVSEYCSLPVFPVLVFQLSKQQKRTRTTPQPYSEPLRTVLGQRISPWKSCEAVALSVGFSTGNPPKIGTFTAWNRTRNRTRTPPATTQSLGGSG